MAKSMTIKEFMHYNEKPVIDRSKVSYSFMLPILPEPSFFVCLSALGFILGMAIIDKLMEDHGFQLQFKLYHLGIAGAFSFFIYIGRLALGF